MKFVPKYSTKKNALFEKGFERSSGASSHKSEAFTVTHFTRELKKSKLPVKPALYEKEHFWLEKWFARSSGASLHKLEAYIVTHFTRELTTFQQNVVFSNFVEGTKEALEILITKSGYGGHRHITDEAVLCWI